jgi:hypothetical protein
LNLKSFDPADDSVQDDRYPFLRFDRRQFGRRKEKGERRKEFWHLRLQIADGLIYIPMQTEIVRENSGMVRFGEDITITRTDLEWSLIIQNILAIAPITRESTI